jgi:hypothetical protein
MTKCFVVDACSFKLFFDELIAENEGDCFRSMSSILNGSAIIFDVQGRIRNEWIVTCCGDDDEFLSEWINNKIIEDTIQEREIRRDNQIRAKLTEFGVPQKDHKYIYLAKTHSVNGIVSDDIDFYDPREKNRGNARLTSIKVGRKGRLCRYLQKHHKLLVFPLELSGDFV